MIIYKDIITGDELISDSYDLKEIDGVVYEADCRKITVGGETFDTGANASAEGGDEDAEDSAEQVIDVVYSFRLNQTQFDKKSYLSHLKGYMKKVKETMKEGGASDDAVKEFETKASGYAKKLIGNFKDYEFLIGESMDPDGMVLLLNYREDGVTPYVTFWKHGLKEMKV
ncbi:microtubule/calcium-binding protein [Polychaeton citri CBS 116435]|uniref:Translationally-controlled tumor protein homolog n=1 Tax=Polychaeton citri CBS 116435 TaxID=1314669 RepID=A0A9P4UTH1_9PEZI|nr:microtubule/calcium-binding protein [Polychaeton citri CBS 116435]